MDSAWPIRSIIVIRTNASAGYSTYED
uniref:Uncharacterized protein n=1 Tax=Anguilla anguilla TaxID=7936 RepID=A0A0E9V0U6_ANGAN